MGKKSSAKKTQDAGSPAKKTQDVGSSVAAAAPQPDLSWLDELSAHDRQFAQSLGLNSKAELDQRKAKIELTRKKATEAQQQQVWQNERQRQWEKDNDKQARKKAAEDKKWFQELHSIRQRGAKEGVLEAEDWGEEGWYVCTKAVPKEYKQVEDILFCTHCNKHLNDNTLLAHLDSKAHTKKLEWSQPAPPPPAAAQPSAAAAPAPPAAAPPPAAAVREYPAPELPYLAWVPAPDMPGERWLKCLLCSKWVQDEWSHSGTAASQSGSKEHNKNLRNYGPGDAWYQEVVVKERFKYHPVAQAAPTVRVAPPAPPAPAARPTPTVAPWAAPLEPPAPAAHRTPTVAPWAAPPEPPAPAARPTPTVARWARQPPPKTPEVIEV